MAEDILYFQLSEKLEYSKDGDFFETATIELKPPSMPVFNLTSQLSQDVMKAVLDAREFADESDQNQNEGDIDAATIKMLLLSSKRVKFSDVADTCKVLFCKVGTYDGKTPLKMMAFERMKIIDFVQMICEYIANFIWPSLFSGGADQKTTGDT